LAAVESKTARTSFSKKSKKRNCPARRRDAKASGGKAGFFKKKAAKNFWSF
jgi:hypothetical protein